jgi:tetratricopeptide (TPR) repeat protein
MPLPSGQIFTARRRCRSLRLAWLLGLAALPQGCKPTEKSADPPSTSPPVALAPSTDTLLEQLASARIEAANTKLDQKQVGEALALLISALKANPASTEALTRVTSLLGETVWHVPVLTLDHRLPIDQLHYAPPSSLWVSLRGEKNSTVRWNLDTLQLEAVLFPTEEVATRSLVFSPGNRSVIVERGPTTLLCDAQSLKPIRELGALPDFLTPSAVLPFSPDGLLFANPEFVSATDRSLVWHLRDAASGQIIRSSDPIAAEAAPPLAAFVDRAKLRVIHADGSLLEMPISPVDPITITPMPEPATLLSAQFALDGNAVLTLHAQGPHQPPVHSIVAYSDPDDGSLEIPALMQRVAWSRHPNLWSGLMPSPASEPFAVEENRLQILTGPPHASVTTDTAIAAVAFAANEVVIGTETGRLTLHRLLPLPLKNDSAVPPRKLETTALTALALLSETLTGTRYDEEQRSFVPLSSEERLAIFNQCDFGVLQLVFPTLDFSPVHQALHAINRRTIDPSALLPLWDRLANADFSGGSWPGLLERTQDLAETPWHRDLTATVVARAATPPHNLESRWLARDKMAAIFSTQDPNTILGAIQAAGGTGPEAANALALALQTDHADWIEAVLAQAEDQPPVLRQIALSRIAWIQGRKAAALSPWPENFPSMQEIRRREDWQGWEQADFEPALNAIRDNLLAELAAVDLTEDSTPEQRKAVIERLENPETVAAIGKPRYGQACLKAALILANSKEDAAAAFKLATTARNLGVPAEPCLRAEAMALTATGDYHQAHERWIELITEHPIETQLPADYAEAAYTAFENADPGQAMIILTTGMHRYPQDPNFALRAGWVALLTANPDRAYDFLRAGKRIGYPAEKLENATALLVIAAAQAGAPDDATVYFNDLVKMDPAWIDPETLETLDWPDELKSILRQFMP